MDVDGRRSRRMVASQFILRSGSCFNSKINVELKVIYGNVVCKIINDLPISLISSERYYSLGLRFHMDVLGLHTGCLKASWLMLDCPPQCY